MIRLLVRIITALVIFIFLCIVTLAFGEFFVPDSSEDNRINTPQEVLDAEFEEGLTFLETTTGGQIGAVVVAIPIVLLAGFSETIGHAVVLFANRVRPNRFAVTILVNTLLFTTNYLIWVGMVSLVSFIVFNRETAFIRAAYAVGVAYSPLIYGFLVALPYIGLLISNILYIITAIRLVQLLQVLFPYNLPEAILCTFISLVAVIGFRLTIGRPIIWVRGQLLNAVAGTEVKPNINEALAHVESKGTQA